jgi:hypothetical protein
MSFPFQAVLSIQQGNIHWIVSLKYKSHSHVPALKKVSSSTEIHNGTTRQGAVSNKSLFHCHSPQTLDSESGFAHQ